MDSNTEANAKPVLDPFQQPPDSLRKIYKRFQKVNAKDIRICDDIVDMAHSSSDTNTSRLVTSSCLELPTGVHETFAHFARLQSDFTNTASLYEVSDLPGTQRVHVSTIRV